MKPVTHWLVSSSNKIRYFEVSVYIYHSTNQKEITPHYNRTLQEVGLCGEFTLDGRASSGAASRTLSASWYVLTTSTGHGAAVAAVESALAPFQGSLLATLNSTALEIGVEFTFTLSARNFLGGADKTSVTLTRM